MAWNNAGTTKTKYVHKENRGSMFDNDHKSTDKHPDFTGTVNVEGVLYWISGWTGMTQDGNKRKLALSVKRHEERPTENPPKGQQAKPTRW